MGHMFLFTAPYPFWIINLLWVLALWLCYAHFPLCITVCSCSVSYVFCVMRDLTLDALLLGFNEVKGGSTTLLYIYFHLERSLFDNGWSFIFNLELWWTECPKRASSLGLLKKRNVDIALLQETHLLQADTGCLANRFYHTIASSSASTKTKGIAIVVKQNLPLKVLSSWSDDTGRIVYLSPR